MTAGGLARALAAAVLSVASAAQAVIVPVGGELQANTYTSGLQGFSRVAQQPNGDFVVVWHSTLQDGGDRGIFGQRFDSSGAPLGAEFKVNSYTRDDQSFPALAMDADGDFVVVWESVYKNDETEIFAQRFTSAGVRAGAEFKVNTYKQDYQGYSAVGMSASGAFVVSWTSYGQDGSEWGVFAQRYSSSGAELNGEFQVTDITSQNQRYSVVSVEGDGDFVVVWESYAQDGYDHGIFGKRFTSSGAAVGGEFQVNVYTLSGERYPAMAMAADGSFVVTWHSYRDGSNRGVFARRFGSDGVAIGDELQVNVRTTGHQSFASVTALGGGGFAVVWTSALPS